MVALVDRSRFPIPLKQVIDATLPDVAPSYQWSNRYDQFGGE